MNLKTRDLINIGILAVLYFVVVFASAMLGFIGTAFFLVGAVLSILLNGIVVMLYLARTPKMGMLTVTGLFIGGIMAATGHHWITVVGGALFGFLGDLIATNMGRAKRLTATRGILAYAVFTLWFATPVLPIIWSAGHYQRDPSRSVDPESASTLTSFFTPQMFLAFTALVFIFALIGGWLGARANKRHFARAGLTANS